MIKLGHREPVWLDLAEGVRVKARPLTTPAYAMIQAQAEKVYEDWAEHRASISLPWRNGPPRETHPGPRRMAFRRRAGILQGLRRRLRRHLSV